MTEDEEVAYKRGYQQGVEDALYRVSDWVDEETLDYVKEWLNEKNS